MPKMTKKTLAKKIEAVITKADNCSVKNYPLGARKSFENIGDRLADIVDQLLAQKTPIY